MDISFNEIARLVSFVARIESDTYPESPSPVHTEITAKVLDTLLPRYGIRLDAHILDVGCGQGPALEIFRSKGYCNAVGIALNDDDVRICREKGYVVSKMEQSFLAFRDGAFNFVWARHVIEHSIFPYFTLTEFARVTAPGGYLYLEVPAPETSCHHERNPNHYSVLTKSAWASLLDRSGFRVLDEVTFQFVTGMGPDEYWGFICQK